MSLDWYYDEPEEKRGKFQTQCRDCSWCDSVTYPYQGECRLIECPECGSENLVDVNLKAET